MRQLLLLFAISILPGYLSAQSYQPLWANIDAHLYLSNNSANFAEQYDITTDPSGNVYSVYKLGGTGEIGVVKIAPDGTVLWDVLRTVSNYAPNEIRVDATGNVFVAGYEYTASTNPFGLGMWLMKFDGNGNFLFERYRAQSMGSVQRYYTASTTRPTVMLELDPAGNAYVGGRDYNTAYGYPYVKFFLEKYDHNGISQWTSSGTAISGPPVDMELSSSGQVVMTGGISTSFAHTAAFSSGGGLLWEDTHTNMVVATDVEIDNNGDYVVCGNQFSGTTNMAVARYSPAGALISTTMLPLGYYAIPVSMEVAGNGDYLMAGMGTQLSGMPYVDWIVARFTPSGTNVWADRYNENPNNDEFISNRDESLAIDSNGDVLVTGSGGPTMPQGFTQINSVVTVKYDGNTGTRLGIQIDQSKAGSGMVVIPDGTDFFVGIFGRRKVVKYGSSLLTGMQADLYAFLQGPYGTPTFLRFMNKDLNDAGLLPLNQPYSGAPWNYPGTESVTAIPASVVDWVLVEARTGTGSSSAFERQAAFIHNDGQILDINGNSLNFSAPPSGSSVYFVVTHRNHLSMMSAVAVSANTADKFRFNFASTFAGYGGNLSGVAVNTGVWANIAGDANGDGDVNAVDANLVWQPANGQINVYDQADLNMDGEVNAIDKNLIWAPSNGKTTQVP